MTIRWLLVSLAAGIGAVAPAVLWAQQAPRAQFPDPRLYNDELSPRQIQRSQEPVQRAQEAETPVRASVPPKAKQQQTPPARAVACGGVFAKDSSHLKLATVYKTDVVFTEVDAGDGKKLMASVLFPTDPKRRLEVWWENEAARLGTHLIVINGQSTWAAPKGLRLGLQLAAIERLNGKPFKLKGFNGDNVGQVSDWQGGALAALTGGCKLGVFLRPDAKASADARSGLSASAEFASNDATVKAVKPTVSEIIIGY